MNFTFPEIPVYGESDTRKSLSRSNVFDNSTNNFTKNQNIIQVEEKARVRVKSPFSVALGAHYSTSSRKSAIQFTVEYFHHIDSYAVVNSSLEAPEWLPGFIEDNV